MTRQGLKDTVGDAENLTPQPRNPRKGRGSPEAPPRFEEGFWEGSHPSLIDQQYH